MIEVGPTPGIRPHPSLARRLDAAARRCLPEASALCLLLAAGALPVSSGQEALRPALVLIAVFHWSLLRPASMPPAAVFALGVLCDLLGWMPVGVSAVTLLCTQAVARGLRPLATRRGRGPIWIAFPCVAVAAGALTWGLASLLMLTLLPFDPALLEALVAAALYPALALVLTWADRSIAAPERA